MKKCQDKALCELVVKQRLSWIDAIDVGHPGQGGMLWRGNVLQSLDRDLVVDKQGMQRRQPIEGENKHFNSDGTGPVILLVKSSSRMRDDKVPSCVGNVPVKALESRPKHCRVEICPSSEGTGPVTRFRVTTAMVQ